MKEASSDGAALLHVHAHSRHVHAQQDVGSEVRCGRVSGSEVKRPGWFCYCSPDVIKVLPPLLPSSFPHLLLSILPLFLPLFLPLHPSSLPSVIRPSTFPKTSNFYCTLWLNYFIYPSSSSLSSYCCIFSVFVLPTRPILTRLPNLTFTFIFTLRAFSRRSLTKATYSKYRETTTYPIDRVRMK